MNSREILTAKNVGVCNGKFCAAVAVFALLCYSMFKERLMEEGMKRLFVGIKINKALQDDLDSPAPGMKQYFRRQ
jgi:hypothetical protein